MSTTSKHLPPQRNEESSRHPRPTRRPIRSTVARPRTELQRALPSEQHTALVS
jgi:hypothetical protein